MGKIILCSGKQAKKPYVFQLTDAKVYSIEELCFYLYNNIYAINEDMLKEELITWLTTEVQMDNLVDKLVVLLENHNSLKDIIVTILCSADYYSEAEIKELIIIMDEIENLIPIKRQKIKADSYLKYKMYAKAVTEYEAILSSKEAAKLTPEEYGDILHNLAITHVHITSYKEAAIKYKEAYNLNHNTETLKQYLYALLLAQQDDKFQEEIINYELDFEKALEIKQALDEELIKSEGQENYEAINKLPEIKSAGRVNEYYNKINSMLFEWKTQYRRELTE